MINFGLQRLATSTLRWLVNFLHPWLRGSSFLLITPPWVSRQLILDLENRCVRSLRISTYFDWATVYEVFAREDYLPPKSDFSNRLRTAGQALVEKGQTPLIVDLGANIGVSALLFSWRFPKAHIVCVEPDSRNVELLRINSMQNPRISVLEAAVSNTDGQIGLYRTQDSANNAFQTFESTVSERIGSVSAISPETIMSCTAGATPFILKIDIEGYESQVFSRPANWLDDFPAVMAEIHDWMLPGSASSNNLLAAILETKRDIVISGENLLCMSITPRAAKNDS